MSLSSFSVARPIAISMLCLGIMLCGVVALPRMPLELLPSSAPRQITIITNLRGGIAPREVEERVTRRLEEALGRLSYLDEMESSSLEGRSMIYLRFLPEMRGLDSRFATFHAIAQQLIGHREVQDAVVHHDPSHDDYPE
jgi:hydrophobic/amphiphilic exporter-1 (mainly G- bacteria), HAE1 family